MAETNKDLLNRLDSKLDTLSEEIAAVKLDFALKFSNFENKQNNRFYKLERYLQSDPETNQMGAIEKLDKVDKRVSKLETKATIFGLVGGSVAMMVKYVISIFF
jgi:hypothetical protein